MLYMKKTSGLASTLALGLLLWMSACMPEPAQAPFDLQGHRGARGLMPENTWPAFKRAIDLGVNTLELDVVISGDGLVVVSHEPWLSGTICLAPNGEAIPDTAGHSLNMYKMTYAEISAFDCGSKPHPGFPEQVNMPAYKPLLQTVIDSALQYCQAKGLPPVAFNIELKSTAQGDGEFHSVPSTFSQTVYKVVRGLAEQKLLTIQSFDFRVLQYWQAQWPEVPLALLTERHAQANLAFEELGFTTAIYSPYYKLLDSAQVAGLHGRGIRVIPWTVNEKAAMQQMIKMGVDGLITDYPDRAVAIFK